MGASKGLVTLVLLYICTQAAALTVSVLATTSKSKTLRWTRHPGAGSYLVTVREKSSSAVTAFVQFGANTVMGTVAPLAPNTVYDFTVEALDGDQLRLDVAVVESLTAPPLMDPIQKVKPMDSETLIVEFNSVTGATHYIVRVQNADGFYREDTVYSSPAEIASLAAYTEYTLSIMAGNSGGRSQPSLSVTGKTVLPPLQLSASSPSNDSIVVSWDPVDDALQYTLSVYEVGSNNTITQNTTSTDLTISGLDAGSLYMIMGYGWDPEQRKGEGSYYINQTTRPPMPVSINVSVVMADDLAGLSVSWELDQLVYGHIEYHVISDQNRTCNSTSSLCILSPVGCGEMHTIQVTASNEAGPGHPSMPFDFVTFPCPPESLAVDESVEANCTLSWDTAPYADSYMAYIKRGDGMEETCNTTSNNCTYHCQCGYTHLVSVFAFNDAGSSPQGPVINYTTLPCCPEGVAVTLVSTETLEITWSASLGAELYETRAADGSEVILCNDTAPVCALSDLGCDSPYSVVVTPCNDVSGCNRACGAHTRDTAPCMPTNMQLSQKNSSCVTVSWTENNRAATYSVSAVGAEDTHTCISSGSSCDLTGLPCGSIYDVTTIATSAAGQSLPSYSETLETEPCCPVSLTVDQATQAMTNLSWSHAQGAYSFMASLTSPRGHARCHTQDHHCLMGCITCGTNYTVTMEVHSHSGRSANCTYQGFSSSACCPSGIKLYRTAENSLRLHWRTAGGGTRYTAEMFGSSNYTCTTSAGESGCEVANVQCGEVYHVIVSPLTADGSKVSFCPQRIYSVTCIGSDVGTVIYRRKRSVAERTFVAGRPLSSRSISVTWTKVASADHYYLQVSSQDGSQMFNLTFTETSAVVADLTPSTNYDCFVYTVNHAGVGRRSKVRTVTTLMQPPVGVTATQTGLDTARVTWQPVEDVLVYRVEVQNADEPGGEPTVYNVTDTRLDVDSIMPCSTYKISVSSFNNFLVPSEPTVYTYTTNKLTPVSAVSVDYSCTSQSVMVHWTGVFGADSYRATAMDQNGTLMTCTSQSTSCHIGGLSCDQTFKVHVTPISENCENMANTTWATFETVPCGPKNLELLHDCSSQVIIFSWEHTNNTEHYTARAVDSEGVIQECLTVDNSCYFTNTLCGRQYFFTVDSISGHCKSQTSSTVDIRTEPCIPQNLQTSADCNSNLLVSTWDLAEGALRYTVDAFGNKGKSHYNCSTLSNSCAMEGVHCGEYLTIFITAFDDKCASPRKLGPVAETAVKECGADSITVSWAVTGSTLFYIAMARDSDGVVHSCNTMGLTCTFVGLKCSTFYTAHVIGSNFMCNSSQSEAVTIETDNVTASLDCTANEAVISWHGQPEINSFTASIVDEDDRLLSCSSTTTSCRVPNLKCGRLYTVTVCHHDSICPSMPSQPIYMDSAPCAPQNLTAVPACEENGAMVTWAHSHVATSYQLTAAGTDGHVANCNGSVNNCTLADLHCGQPYSLSLTARGENCTSEPTTTSFTAVPCAPSGLAVDYKCENNAAVLTWTPAEGATAYHACAKSTSGEVLSCDSANASCAIEGLRCGDTYNFSVEASDGYCNSSYGAPVENGAAPCAPTALDVGMQRVEQNHWLMSSWETVDCPDVEYLVEISGRIQDNPQALMSVSSYWRSVPYFETRMPCSTPYNLTVRSRNSAGASEPSVASMGVTVPCAPNNVQYSGSTQSATLSWDASVLATGYSVYDVSGEGRVELCSTVGLSCQLANFSLDYMEVIASNAVGESIPSGNVTGPVESRRKRDLRASQVHSTFDKDLEVPKLLNVTVKGAWLHVRWARVNNASEYTLVIVEEQRQQADDYQPRVRIVEGDFYTESALKPWTTYCVRLAARSPMGQSDYCRPKCKTTGDSK
nr:uncharacterized protein LOC133616849 [Nerophis lumbriciformis]